jgi:uncharacterized protein
MTGALLLTGALMGLAATPHCAAMCAAPCAAAARACATSHHSLALWSTLLGRVVAYAAAGAVAASVLGATRWLADGAQWLRPLWALLQAGVLVAGLWLLWQGRLPLGWDRFTRPVSNIGDDRAASGTVALPWPKRTRAAAAGLGVGLLWVAIPCGVLHAAVAVAALASTPAEGAGVMAAFALTSSLALVAGPQLAAGIARLAGPWPGGMAPSQPRTSIVSGSMALRAAGLTLSLMALWSLGHMIADPQAPLC